MKRRTLLAALIATTFIRKLPAEANTTIGDVATTPEGVKLVFEHPEFSLGRPVFVRYWSKKLSDTALASLTAPSPGESNGWVFVGQEVTPNEQGVVQVPVSPGESLVNIQVEVEDPA